MNSQNVYEYNKVKVIDDLEYGEHIVKIENDDIRMVIKRLKDKINELTIEQNHLMKDFELYKKAFKRFVSEARNEN